MLRVTRQNIDAATKIRSLPELSSWADADKALEDLCRYFPDNTNRVHVLIKASAIDKLYSTRAGNIFWVADAIVAVMKEKGNLSPSGNHSDNVEDISDKKLNSHLKANRCLSFASKYCHFFVDSSIFPLYDSFALDSVKNLLGTFRNRRIPTESEYQNFCRRLLNLKIRDGLKMSVSERWIDSFGFGGNGFPKKIEQISLSTNMFIVFLHRLNRMYRNCLGIFNLSELNRTRSSEAFS